MQSNPDLSRPQEFDIFERVAARVYANPELSVAHVSLLDLTTIVYVTLQEVQARHGGKLVALDPPTPAPAPKPVKATEPGARIRLADYLIEKEGPDALDLRNRARELGHYASRTYRETHGGSAPLKSGSVYYTERDRPILDKAYARMIADEMLR